MARLRTTRAVRILTAEEKVRVANLFTLLIEINLQMGVINKRRAPKTTKAKKKECNKPSRMNKAISPAARDLYLKRFNSIFKDNAFNFIIEYCNDRHYCLNTCSRFIHYS